MSDRFKSVEFLNEQVKLSGLLEALVYGLYLGQGPTSKPLLNIALYTTVPINAEVLQVVINLLFLLLEVVQDSFLTLFLHGVLLGILEVL